MDLARQAQQEQEIKDLEAAQAQYRRARAEGLTAPFQAGAEAYVGQMALERMLSDMSPEQRQRYIDMQFMQRLGQGAQSMRQGMANAFAPRPGEISIREAMSMNRPIESYSYDEMLQMGMTDREIQDYFYDLGERTNPNIRQSSSIGDVPAMTNRTAGIY